MAFEVNCPKCSARFTLPDDLYERKVKGRVVTVRCRKCQADISVNGTQLGSKPSNEKPTLDLTPTGRLPKTTDMTPTVPVAVAAPKKAATPHDGLWLVSYADDDDRELSVAQIKQALLKGEIDGQTIVWNSRMDDWKPIAEIPELAGKPDAVGGFLGTGSQVTTVVHEPALRDSSAPALVPGKEENDILGEDELGPFRSVSAGTLGFDDDDAPPVSVEPISLSEPLASADFKKPQPPRVTLGKPVVGGQPKPEAKPEEKKPEARKPPPPRREPAKVDKPPESNPPPKPKVLPQAPKKLQPDWLSEAKPEDDEAPPSSQGTPNLKDLAVFAPKPEVEAPPEKKPAASAEEDILGVGGGGLMAGIDISNLPPPVSSRPPPPVEEDVDVVPESQAPKSRRSRSKRPGARKSDRPEARARSERPVTKTEAPLEKKPDSRSSGMIWLVAAGLGIVAVWWIFFRAPSDKPGATTTPSATAEPAARTVETPKPEPTNEVVPAPTPDPDAGTPTTPETTTPPAEKNEKTEPTEKKEPTEPKEPTEKKEPSEKKEPVATTKEEPTGDVDMAPPFDKAAAVAALNGAAGQASSCRQAGDPSGMATVVVTFAPSGRATNANLSGPPFAGTATGGCIAAAMRRAKIPAFSGSHMTVSKTVIIQ
jgi:cytoskeletal protein RodZ